MTIVKWVWKHDRRRSKITKKNSKPYKLLELLCLAYSIWTGFKSAFWSWSAILNSFWFELLPNNGQTKYMEYDCPSWKLTWTFTILGRLHLIYNNWKLCQSNRCIRTTNWVRRFAEHSNVKEKKNTQRLTYISVSLKIETKLNNEHSKRSQSLHARDGYGFELCICWTL